MGTEELGTSLSDTCPLGTNRAGSCISACIFPVVPRSGVGTLTTPFSTSSARGQLSHEHHPVFSLAQGTHNDGRPCLPQPVLHTGFNCSIAFKMKKKNHQNTTEGAGDRAAVLSPGPSSKGCSRGLAGGGSPPWLPSSSAAARQGCRQAQPLMIFSSCCED